MASGFFKATSSLIGRSVVGLDLNADGLDDAIYGADQSGTGNGIVTVLYGDAGGFDASVDLSGLTAAQGFSVSGTVIDGEFGAVVAKADNLDGVGDALLIGSRAAGTVSVVFSGAKTVGLTITGLPDLADGMSLTGLGDFNGDGIGDFAIGAPGANSGTGAVYVIYGSTSFGATLDVSNLNGSNGFVINGFSAYDAGGTAIAGAGDVDGDGKNDLLIGVPGHDDGLNTDAGTAYIVHGTGSAASIENIAATTTLKLTSFTGAAAGDATGSAVSGGQDVNGNGKADIIIGAPLADPNGASSGIAYVVFDSVVPPTTVDLSTLDGSNGYTITGLSADDRVGASVQMLGDVSGDGIGDVGVVTKSGDVYLVFGSATNAATVDLSTLDGTNGYTFTGLFSGASSVSIMALGDINGDPSGPIGDISVTATFNAGAASQTVTVLGGTENFAALDTADGYRNGLVAFDALPLDVPFVQTNLTIVTSGDRTKTITEDTVRTEGTIGITDSSKPSTNQPTFANSGATGALGVFAVNNAGNLWTYTVTDNRSLQYLGVGDVINDAGTLVADNGTQRKIKIEIQGLDDVAVAFGDTNLTVQEDYGRVKGAISLNDPDAGENPSLGGATGKGVHGNIEVGSDGTYTYFLTNPKIQALNAGQKDTDSITLLASDGSRHTVTIDLIGQNEGEPLIFDNNANEIYTSFGNDVIKALGGNDFIDGGAGNDSIDAGTGDDTVFDLLGNDTVFGGTGNDDIALLTGNNQVDGGEGSDFIKTGFQDDVVSGGAGDDVIAADVGGNFIFGNNKITGGVGNDVMMGGLGIDTFVFGPSHGNNIIGAFDPDAVIDGSTGFTASVTGHDFQPGIDIIQIVGFSGVTDANVLSFVSNTANGVQFSNAGTTILLRDVLTIPDATDFDII